MKRKHNIPEPLKTAKAVLRYKFIAMSAKFKNQNEHK
jgi:hypothetical protein